MQTRRRIHVAGIVQGVGFRPYVYRLATERHLAGQIANTSSGVVIEVEGAAEVVDDFLSSLPAQAPPLALVTDIRVVEIHSTGESDFCILPSDPSASVQRSFHPTSQRARIASANYSILPTAAITILSLIVRTAAQDSPS